MYICVSKDKCYFGSNYFCISMLYSCNGTDILECLVIDTFIGFLILYAEYIINGFQVGMRAASYETLLFLLEIFGIILQNEIFAKHIPFALDSNCSC